MNTYRIIFFALLSTALLSCAKGQYDPEESTKPLLFSKNYVQLLPEENIIADTIIILNGSGKYKLSYTGGWSNGNGEHVYGEKILRDYVEADLKSDTIFIKIGVLKTHFPCISLDITDSIGRYGKFDIISGLWSGPL